MANKLKTETIFEQLKKYNEHVYNNVCSKKSIIGLFDEYKISTLIQEENYKKAAWAIQQLDFRYTIDDEDFTYEISNLLDLLRCSDKTNIQINAIQTHKEEHIKVFISTLEKNYEPIRAKDTNASVPDDRFLNEAFFDAYYYYTNFKIDKNDMPASRKAFINIVIDMINAKDHVSFKYPLRIKNKDLLLNLKKSESHIERLEILRNTILEKYDEDPNANLDDVLEFDNPSHVKITSFITKNGGVRQSLWKYSSDTLSWADNKFFLFLLALYVGFPLTSDYEHFFNLHGHTLNNQLLPMKKHSDTIIYDYEVKEWLEQGLSVACILELLKK